MDLLLGAGASHFVDHESLKGTNTEHVDRRCSTHSMWSFPLSRNVQCWISKEFRPKDQRLGVDFDYASLFCVGFSLRIKYIVAGWPKYDRFQGSTVAMSHLSSQL